MTDTIQSDSPASVSSDILQSADGGIEKISALLGDLGKSPAAQSTTPISAGELTEKENGFLVARLGVAASLFYCLRGKHRQTADHSLRVALGCSAWADRLGLPAEIRDRLEIAALLHDIGKIATPDRILKKPSHLSGDEKRLMDAAPEMACDILHGCCQDEELLDIIRYSRCWFKGADSNALSGDRLPLGARMLAIVESFDSMTTDHVYRRALSRERAVSELFQFSGTQFDPNLVRDFAALLENRPEVMYGSIARRWLRELNDASSNHYWSASSGNQIQNQLQDQDSILVHKHLLNSMGDGVVAIDRQGMITHWNFAFQKMSNIAGDAMLGQSWSDKIVKWHDPRKGGLEQPCYLLACLTTQTQTSRRLRMRLPDGKESPVMVTFVPVFDNQNTIQGAFAIVSDISQEESLAQEVRSLHLKATRDGLTGVANRSEFDRMIAELVELAANGKTQASMIMCDIDRFKSINDNHGHQAGDDALVSFASILSRHSRNGDLVARYGGEEFVLLCPGCDNSTAAKRAEVIRQELERAPQPALGGKCITSSFGVTEFQPGDTTETMIARADRALYKAKENGRNRVVQLGSGTVDLSGTKSPAIPGGWLAWLTGRSKIDNIQAEMKTPVPVELVVEKLRGFIADHDAEIIKIKGQSLELCVEGSGGSTGRRSSDGHEAFHVFIDIAEQAASAKAHVQTIIQAQVTPWRSRDRRNRETMDACQNVIASLKSYLMAEYTG